MSTISPNLMKYMNLHIQAQQTPSRINSKRSTPRHTAIKLLKATYRESWKQQEKKIIMHKESSIRQTADFSPENMEVAGWNIQSAKKKKKLSTKNSISGQTILQKLRKN